MCSWLHGLSSTVGQRKRPLHTLRLGIRQAAVGLAAHLGWLDLSGSWLSFVGSRAAIVVLSLLALGELVADKLPKTPNRTDLGPLVFRAITGGFSSIAICASAHQSLVISTILGVLGSIAGAFAGYEIGHRLVEAFRLPDYGVAAAEDIVAIGGGLLARPPYVLGGHGRSPQSSPILAGRTPT